MVENQKTKKKDFVEIEFIGKNLTNNEVFDTNIKEEAKKINLEIKDKPLMVCIGGEMLVKGFDSALELYLQEKNVNRFLQQDPMEFSRLIARHVVGAEYRAQWQAVCAGGVSNGSPKDLLKYQDLLKMQVQLFVSLSSSLTVFENLSFVLVCFFHNSQRKFHDSYS